MLKIKLIKIFFAKPILEKIYMAEAKVIYKFKLRRIFSRINNVFNDIDHQRNILIKKYGETIDKEGNNFQVKPENLEIFNKEFGEFLNEEVEIDIDTENKMDENWFGNAVLTSRDLDMIDFLLPEIPEVKPVYPKEEQPKEEQTNIDHVVVVGG